MLPILSGPANRPLEMSGSSYSKARGPNRRDGGIIQVQNERASESSKAKSVADLIALPKGRKEAGSQKQTERERERERDSRRKESVRWTGRGRAFGIPRSPPVSGEHLGTGKRNQSIIRSGPSLPSYPPPSRSSAPPAVSSVASYVSRALGEPL